MKHVLFGFLSAIISVNAAHAASFSHKAQVMLEGKEQTLLFPDNKSSIVILGDESYKITVFEPGAYMGTLVDENGKLVKPGKSIGLIEDKRFLDYLRSATLVQLRELHFDNADEIRCTSASNMVVAIEDLASDRKIGNCVTLETIQ